MAHIINSPQTITHKMTKRTHTVIVGGYTSEQLQQYLDRRSQDPRCEDIRMATIVDSRTLDVQFTVESNDGTETTNKKCPHPIHDDLRKAFSRLHDHLGRLCDQPLTMHNPAYKDDKTLPALICPIHCTGFKMKGRGEKQAVILMGHRTLSNAKDIDLCSPSQQFNGDIYYYEQMAELEEIITECVAEVEMYLFEGKHQPDAQLDMFQQQEELDGE